MRLVKLEFWVPEGTEAQVACYVEEGIRRHIGQVQASEFSAAIAAATDPTLAEVTRANAKLRLQAKVVAEA